MFHRRLGAALPRSTATPSCGPQRVFDRTEGLHAAGLFSAEGELLDLREDLGRHNAVGKLIGRALQFGALPLSRTISAPSSLAVDRAAETGLTLVGFLRGSSMHVYAGE